ncbi:MAG: NADH:ubiquinone oxidoreductase [Nitrospinae bacterium]|nr:NADH:ubiquinone oxidoreductase [Nitrospinota bacterium]
MKRPRVAFFDFTCCEGCQLEVSNLEDRLIDLTKLVDIVMFREVMSEKDDTYDIAFVEGGISRETDIPRLEGIRKRAEILVAIGSCAAIGGINCIKNFKDLEEVKKIVYGRDARYFDTILAQPIDAVVKVEHYLYGCPMIKEEFLDLITSLISGKRPVVPNYPVCIECKLQENLCMFHKGVYCLGPITRGGCKAICITYGNSCEGCRGLVDDVNINSQTDIMKEHGLSLDDALSKFKLYGGYLR